MMTPSCDEFLALAKRGNLIPVYHEMRADLDTPVSAYFKIAAASDYSFLLESVEGGETIARYSFLAREPEIVITAKDGDVVVEHRHGRVKQDVFKNAGSPLAIIRGLMKRYRFVSVNGLPRFCGGLVGYIGYDTVRHFEHLPDKPADDLGLPDALLMLARDLVIFDHVSHSLKIVSCVLTEPDESEAARVKKYQHACSHIKGIIRDMEQPLAAPKRSPRRTSREPVFTSNMTERSFKQMVTRAKKEIFDGEIIQVVLSQRFEARLQADAFDVYRALRTVNPSPYMYYLKFGGVQIAGSSPELLVRCEEGRVETRPIAGTRPRGRDEQEDAALAASLLADPKERAEHVMLVDLGRNDLGRVCVDGSVEVPQFMDVERYSHVMHLVSRVRGRLRRGKDAFDVLAAAFPAGTLSGAPKVRAMQIIDALEPTARGPYGGCIGYFSFSGNFDSCITIRTIVVANGKAYIQAGAGIVADSQPIKEYHETENKARALMVALRQACGYHEGKKRRQSKGGTYGG